MEKREVDRSGKNNVEMRSIKLTYIFILLIYSQIFSTHTHESFKNKWVKKRETMRGEK